jgi:LysM repeat protein
MPHLLTLLLAGLLLLPFTVTTAEAKTPSAVSHVHVVKQGDSLYEIARLHGLTVNELKRLNGLSSSRLKIGQKLALDRAAAPPLPKDAYRSSSKKAATVATGGKSVHVVKKGDSLHTIGQRHGLSVAQLRQLNDLRSDKLRIGQKLKLSDADNRTDVANAPGSGKTSSRNAVEQHVVKKGETLSTIARRYHVTVNELKRLNGLRSANLKIGQRLALADPYENRSPLLLPGDSSDDEVLEMAYTAGSELEQAAFNFLSTPYRFGGNSRKGIDCSAFVQQVFREVDVNLPRSAREQYRVGEKIERDDMQKGDLIFFRTYAKFPSHVGIYLGDGKMIHASSRSRRVVVTSIDHPYYRKRFIGAKRISLLDEEESLAVSKQLLDVDEEDRDDVAAPVETPSLLAAGEVPEQLMTGVTVNPGTAPGPNAFPIGTAAGKIEPAAHQGVSTTPPPLPPIN